MNQSETEKLATQETVVVQETEVQKEKEYSKKLTEEIIDLYAKESPEPLRIIVDDVTTEENQKIIAYIAQKGYKITLVSAEEKLREQQTKIVKERDKENNYIHLSLLAKKGCKSCWSRGYIGIDTKSQTYVPCHCAQKKLQSLSGNERDTLIMKTKIMFKESEAK